MHDYYNTPDRLVNPWSSNQMDPQEDRSTASAGGGGCDGDGSCGDGQSGGSGEGGVGCGH